MVADYPKRLRIEAITMMRPRRRRNLDFILHKDGAVYLSECAWNFYTHSTFGVATTAAFRLCAAATRAHGGRNIEIAGLMFDDPSPAPRLRVEVTGGFDSSHGLADWMTATLLEGDVVVDASVPILAPDGDGDQALRLVRFRRAAQATAGVLFRDRHDFLAGRPVP